jgi:hypothetical protein
MAKEKAKKLYSGVDGRTFNLFWRANNGSQPAVRRIVESGRFDAWVRWNLEFSANMDALTVLLKLGMKPDDAKFDPSLEYAKTILRERPYHELYASLSEAAYQATKGENGEAK